MGDGARRLRDRAKECRVLSKGARNQSDRAFLQELAEELEDEAEKIDAEQVPPDPTGGSPA
jgi:hypothetical protein